MAREQQQKIVWNWRLVGNSLYIEKYQIRLVSSSTTVRFSQVVSVIIDKSKVQIIISNKKSNKSKESRKQKVSFVIRIENYKAPKV